MLILTSRFDQFMRKIRASEAKAKLAEILDFVERGESVVITRHGSKIARIIPERESQVEEIQAAVAAIRRLRTRTKPVTTSELLSARDEGRKR